MIFFALLFLLAPLSAHAYLDPGTMSMIINMIVGVLVGIMYTIRVFWRHIKDFFKSLSESIKKDNTEDFKKNEGDS